MKVWIVCLEEYHGATSILNICRTYDCAVRLWEMERVRLMRDALKMGFDISYDQLKNLKIGDATNWYYPVIKEYDVLE